MLHEFRWRTLCALCRPWHTAWRAGSTCSPSSRDRAAGQSCAAGALLHRPDGVASAWHAARADPRVRQHRWRHVRSPSAGGHRGAAQRTPIASGSPERRTPSPTGGVAGLAAALAPCMAVALAVVQRRVTRATQPMAAAPQRRPAGHSVSLRRGQCVDDDDADDDADADDDNGERDGGGDAACAKRQAAGAGSDKKWAATDFCRLLKVAKALTHKGPALMVRAVMALVAPRWERQRGGVPQEASGGQQGGQAGCPAWQSGA